MNTEEVVYFHELTEDEINAMPLGTTWGQVAEKHPQPPWCSYPNALHGAMGCWSLTGWPGTRRIHAEDDCKQCELYQSEREKKLLAKIGHLEARVRTEVSFREGLEQGYMQRVDQLEKRLAKEKKQREDIGEPLHGSLSTQAEIHGEISRLRGYLKETE